MFYVSAMRPLNTVRSVMCGVDVCERECICVWFWACVSVCVSECMFGHISQTETTFKLDIQTTQQPSLNTEFHIIRGFLKRYSIKTKTAITTWVRCESSASNHPTERYKMQNICAVLKHPVQRHLALGLLGDWVNSITGSVLPGPNMSGWEKYDNIYVSRKHRGHRVKSIVSSSHILRAAERRDHSTQHRLPEARYNHISPLGVVCTCVCVFLRDWER